MTGDELKLTESATASQAGAVEVALAERPQAETTVRELLARSFDRHSRDIAIRWQDQQISYAALDRAADRLAAKLLEQGQGSGSIVAVALSDRVAVITALIATLRAGCVFAPLDPNSAPDRLRKAAALLQADCVIAADGSDEQSRLFDDVRSTVVVTWPGDVSLANEEHGGNGRSRPTDRINKPFGSDGMCYVYFTSGSTGTPKGIAGCVKGLSHFIRWELGHFDMHPGQRFSQFVVPTFDAYLRDVLVPLCSGGTICIPPEADLLLDTDRVVGWISENRIEVIHTVPSVFSTIVNAGDAATQLDALQYVLLSGEAVQVADVRKWRTRFGTHTRLVNLYGPTETTMTKFCHIIEDKDLERDFIPIGKPIEGSQALVMRDGQPCSPGMVGEILIRTAYRTLGYYRQPELTQEVFVQNPFTDDPTDLVYKTGDLARQLRDGNFQFCGRKDRQLKIRGNRVEPGEIEAVLAEHPQLKQVVVTPHEAAPGDLRLAAYVVASDLQQPPATSALRDFLQSRLPDYMIPATITLLEILPLKPNGKIDHSALPKPDRTRPQLKTEYEAPRNEDEEQLAAIWSEVLRIDKVGIHDNFFELGGHSLLATQVIARAREFFQVELPLRELFDAQTIASLAVLARNSEKTTLVPQITRDLAQKAVPLSFAQERLWFLDQLIPESPLYNISRAVRVSGSLQIDALRQALNEIVRRHEVLRTTFPSIQGDPLQSVASSLTLDLAVADLGNCSPDERETEATRLAHEEANRPFDLQRGPLIRAKAIRLDEDDHILLLTVHHIVFDAWSGGVMLRELGTLYDAFARGEPSPLPEPNLQYADFVKWQRDWLGEEALEQQMAYWRSQLADVSALELPTDRPRPAVRKYHGATYRFEIPADVTDSLRSFCGESGATIFMTLLSAFQALLARYSGQHDIAVGSPIAGRQRAELEGLIGFFVNTLVLRADLADDPCFRDLVEQMRENCLDAYARQDLPFEKLVVELEPDRNLKHSPLFQVMFVLQNAPTPTIAVPGGLRLTPMRQERTTARFDLTLEVVENPTQLSASFRYDTELFDIETIERMSAHFLTLLGTVLLRPDEPLSRISLLSESERTQLLQEWSGGEIEPQSACIHALFEQQVARTPERVAATFYDDAISYRQLDERANQLAHHLTQLGVGPDVFVGIHMERSLEMLVGLLGVLKAGGAYVPLDPRAPESRLEVQMGVTETQIVISQQRLASAVEARCQHTICVDAEWDGIAKNPSSAPVVRVEPENAAYVIFTSGSTGQPKGVAIEHRQICSYVVGLIDRLNIDPGLRYALLQPLSVDSCKSTIFPPLVTGGCLQIFSEDDSLNAPKLEQAFAQPGIDCLKIAPTHLAALQSTASSPERVLPRRLLIVGGEESKRDWLTGLVKLVPQCEVFNHYGPTETTVGVLTFPAGELTDETAAAGVPLGRPLPGTRCYVLDPELKPLPVGLPGELYVAGALVARGYLNEPQITADRFVPDPFSGIPGSRLYKTGDRCRWLKDGTIEFMGRTDNQIKIRGFRIEPGEVESALVEHSTIESAVVIGHEDTPGDKQLVAYVVFDSDSQATTEELRSFLSSRLPAHMVPSAFVTLPELPRTRHGKLDRKALPAPERVRVDVSSDFVAPSTTTEIKLAEIVCEVLRLEMVGIHDDFFELGGHSLTATQVIARTHEAFGVALPLRRLFETHTIAGLAPLIDQALATADDLNIERGAHDDQGIPLSFAQERLWFLDQLHPGSSLYNIATAIRVRGPLNVDALRRAVNEIVRRHESLRTTLPSIDGRPVQEIAPTLTLDVPVKDLRALEGDEKTTESRRLAVEVLTRPFDLANGPLLRVEVMRLEDDEHAVTFGVHHIVFDGWSRGVFIRELALLYEAYSHDQPSPLPELSLQYADFTTWQRRWLSGDVLDSELAFWVDQLGDVPHSLELPTDRPRPAIQTINGATYHSRLPSDLTSEIKAVARENGATTFMTLLAAFQVLLHRYTGQDDILVGTPIAGRTTRQTEDLIGLFINTLVLRGNLSGDPSFEEFLARVRDVTLDAYAHQVVPFEQLLRTVQPVRDMSRSPLFQVLFVLQNVPPPKAELPGMNVEPVPLGRQSAKFDINLGVVESGDGLRFGWEFNTDLFDESTIERMMTHLRRLLEEIVQDSSRPVSQLCLMSDDETKLVVDAWNPTTAAIRDDGLILDAFDAQARSNPEATAVVHGEQGLTYEELASRANRLAHFLQDHGVGPDVTVGLCIDRSLEMVVGMLGIVKAGGAYVPLDPDYPSERLAFMLEDSRVALVLTQETLLDVLPESEIPHVCLDRDWDDIGQYNPDQPVCSATGQNLAYVIFTSGSTGRPNGVQVPHSALANYARSVSEDYELSSADRVLQFASISFDIAVEEVFATLISGATLVLRTDAMMESISDLFAHCAEQGVTVLDLPTAFWHECCNAIVREEAAVPDSVRLTIIGGERAEPALVDEWQRRIGSRVQLLNSYGPTETTVAATCFDLTRDVPADSPRANRFAEVSIGKPFAGARTYVLDDSMNPTPIGVPGELYIGGPGLARGYLDRPDLTAERFVPDPFGESPGSRLYKTGDRCRWLPDGNLQFLGRTDHQLKIRGFRIEPAEIESVLVDHPSVAQAVVVPFEDRRGGMRLVAYLAQQGDETVSNRDFRQFLRARVPVYMVPSDFVVLASLPLTPSGKIDRAALPSVGQIRPDADKQFIPPQTPLEEQLAAIWCEVLDVERMGIDENFFEFGGHSLLATQLVSRVRATFGIELPLRKLFESPTIEEFALVVEETLLDAIEAMDDDDALAISGDEG